HAQLTTPNSPRPTNHSQFTTPNSPHPTHHSQLTTPNSPQKKFRIRRAEVLEWNQQFWADHNSRFFKEKEEYVQSLKELSADSNKNVTQEELSPFYKAFLDKNRITHLNYNKECLIPVSGITNVLVHTHNLQELKKKQKKKKLTFS
ncbi:cytochrome c oxidase assembly factor 8-like, partial [Physella acuta]|uniref:cytochrome c oxidase assembly factor 8-like n=1 Tax=Physella acuta TaxID=109671 RepID=UPI0027DAE9A9